MKPASNRQLTLLRKLNRKKYREKEQLFFIEGERAVGQVLENGTLTVRLLCFDVSGERWMQPPWNTESDQVESVQLDGTEFEEISDTDNPQGVLALCEMPAEAEPDTLMKGDGLLVALDGLQDPGNLGTVIRTAAWFGSAGVISGKGTVDLFHPKVVRSTAGATGVLPWMNGELDRLLPAFEERGWRVWLLDAPEGDSVTLPEAVPTGRDLLVVGNEANGIRPPLLETLGQRLSIPSAGSPEVESLNAAVALSIALYRFSAG